MISSINIQRTIIHGLLWADKDSLNGLEIKNYLFDIPLHEKIIKCVEWLYSNDKEITQDIIMYHVNKFYPLSVEDQNEHLEILCTNPITVGTMKAYLEVLEDSYNERKREI